jgi:hypothetical protein
MTQLDAYAIQVTSTASDKAPVHTKTPGNGCKDYKINALPTQTTGVLDAIMVFVGHGVDRN